MSRSTSAPRLSLIATLALLGAGIGTAHAQEVCLPAPRLLTISPMGAQVGTTVDVTVTGENIDGATALLFSTPGVTAKPKTGADGKVVANQYTVAIAPDAQVGVHDARLITRLGVSASRAFSVTRLTELTRSKPNQSAETALTLTPNSVCNATMTKRAVDFYAFDGKKGQRVIVDCAAVGIDSKLSPVVIVADAQGRDLVANRIDGVIDFTPPADGKYLVKVHSLTFQGGAEHFYRLALMDAPADGPAPRQPATRTVSSFSWSGEASGLPVVAEAEPNNEHAQAQKITPPCEITGRFFPAADVDTYEFAGKKGETWWVEVVSERQGLAVNPFVVVQKAADGKFTDVAELDDIASPMKPSSNGYSYDGPPYDAGSTDPLGKVEIKEDGVYHLQIRDLFGGTRTDASHTYKLMVRKAAPDFALTGWALHMTLRNGDRNALSKPIALRGGLTTAFEIVVVRKDGFDGEIELAMEGLPEGITATGLRIPAGKSKGMMLITAAENAPASFGTARIIGRAKVGDTTISRECKLASMSWPVRDASQEIPKPRLLADTPVSVSGTELAPLTIAPAEDKVWTAKAGEKLTIPLKATWRNDFAGTSIKLKALGDGFEAVKEFDVPLKAEKAEAVLDLAALKTKPGKYTLAFFGPAVAKYKPAVKLTDTVKGDAAEAKAAPKDTVDILVSQPVRIEVQ